MTHRRRFTRTERVGTWISLDRENIVRLIRFEDLPWGLESNFAEYDVAYCHSGGPFALYNRTVCSYGNRGSCIKLYNANGTAHAVTPQIYLDDMTNLMFLCWNRANDHLVVVSSTGGLRFFNLRGESLNDPLRVPVPSLCASTGNGVALLVGMQDLRLVLVESDDTNEYQMISVVLPRLSHGNKPDTMLAVPSRFSDTGRTEVFVPFLESKNVSSVYHVVFNGKYVCLDLGVYVEGGRFMHMALSPNGQNVAFMVRDGSIYVSSRSFDDITRLFNINTEVMPFQFLWCGDKCITYLHRAKQFDAALHFTTTLSVLSADEPDKSDYLNDIPVDAFLVPDCDGVRILSGGSYQFLQVVPGPVQRIFSVGSRAKSALLLSGFDEFMCGCANSVKIIRDLQKDVHGLSEAVDDCIATAEFELNVSQQKRMMRVAAFGKSFCPIYESDVFVGAARRLRAVNMLCRSKAGTLLSHAQLLNLDNQLIKRLTSLNYHQLAFYICEMLGFSAHDVITDWAMLVLTGSSVPQADEKYLVLKVVEKMKSCNQRDFCELARRLYQKQKTNAALLLLESETLASKQVSCLLEIDQQEAALWQAIKSGDTDLIFAVMMALVNARGDDAVAILRKYPISRKLLFACAKVDGTADSTVTKLFRAYPDDCVYLHLLHYVNAERLFVKDCGKETEGWEALHDARLSIGRSSLASCGPDTANWGSSSSVVGGVSRSLASDAFRVSPANEKWLRSHLNLLEEQKLLTKKFNDKRFLNASVARTITLCHEHGCRNVADRIRSNFSVSNKMNTWCMVKAAASAGQWSLIDHLSDVKGKGKCAVGGFPFVRLLLANERQQQARPYISKIPQIEWRMEYYVLCGDWKMAGADCHRHSEQELLEQLKERTKGNPTALQLIDEGWNSIQESGTVRLAKLFS